MVRAMRGVELKDKERSTDLMFMLGLKETIYCWLWQTVFVGMVMC